MNINYTELLNDLKKLLEEEIKFPSIGLSIELLAESIAIERQKYIIVVRRSKRNIKKCTFHAMTSETKVGLLRLDVGETLIHKNMDGKLVKGTHLHIYKKGIELADAIEINDNQRDLVDYCLYFLKEFKVEDIESIKIVCYKQEEKIN